jgi:imidazolonepropionase-like amidohydrolase
VPGKLADMILVNGDPSAHIGELRQVELVIKDGKLFDPAHIEAALGIAPRAKT